ncbi:hypothetical protein HX780_16970 [Pseudomonas tolaasii]|uniref:M12 family metallopeptidase n=1 Tax=Pseudomonas tolaasii TaxID=29442 RepID=UPI0015A2367C|nr:M12 family metallopeptidase [Pseudomonas tolaasii]NVZ46051.1 hypothetical protein [Pseudomonas tolaasii]NWA49977.1 hypothetical protein [Pseudomonas tolaasii]
MITISPAVNHTSYPIDPDTTPQHVETAEAQTVVRNKRGVANHSRLWPQNKTITISFMDVAGKDKEIFKEAIGSIAPYVNLQFKFVDGNDGEIRIATEKNEGDWSELGVAALYGPPDEATLNVDTHGFDDNKIRSKILHEFGHALGLEHEHQHPDRSFSLNIPDVYRTFGAGGASTAVIASNIIAPLNPADVTTSDYDQKSVMHYPFLASSTSNNVAIPANDELSQGDKDFLASLYPPPRKVKRKWPSAEELVAYRIFSKQAQQHE